MNKIDLSTAIADMKLAVALMLDSLAETRAKRANSPKSNYNESQQLYHPATPPNTRQEWWLSSELASGASLPRFYGGGFCQAAPPNR